MAISKAFTEEIWLRRLLSSLDCSSTIIYLGNQSAIRLTKNPPFHDKSKHIAIQVHFVPKQVQQDLLSNIRAYTKTNTTIVLI